MKPEVLIARLPALQEQLSVDFETQGRLAVGLRGVFTVALSGGSLVSDFLPELARLPFDWSRTEFFWADERAVPPTDPASNYGGALAAFLTPARVPAERIHRMRGEDPDLEKAAREYAEELMNIAGTPPQIDLILLGAGPDGHVASLFPGHPVAREELRPVAAVEGSPKPPLQRLTLTMPVLANACRIIIVALGDRKAEAIRQALEGDVNTPLATLVRRARSVRFLLDEEAARLLSNDVE